MKKYVSLIVMFFLCLSISLTVQASETQTDSEVKVYVVTDGNLTASFDGEAGGDITYYINGVDLTNEFTDVYSSLNSLNSKIKNVNKLASNAYGFAGMAYSYADGNSEQITENIDTLGQHFYMINTTTNNLYLLRDEVISFENDYIGFKNETNTTMIQFDQEIDTNQNNITTNQAEINSLRAQLTDLNNILLLVRNSIIAGLILVGIVFFSNKRYHFGERMAKEFDSLKNGRKDYNILNYIKQSEKENVKSSKTGKAKSVLKNMFSFF